MTTTARHIGDDPVVPATIAGIQKHLGSGMIKGIRPVFATRLVEAFGAETLKVIGETPERLAEVETGEGA
ncbi:MAG: hypothetical protein MZV49_15625 [Rhodopseudomonas palustris]|nr:hypothetical protein [Rhodopseudomonas palustris]